MKKQDSMRLKKLTTLFLSPYCAITTFFFCRDILSIASDTKLFVISSVVAVAPQVLGILIFNKDDLNKVKLIYIIRIYTVLTIMILPTLLNKVGWTYLEGCKIKNKVNN